MDANAEKWVRAEMARVEQRLEARLNGMDKALELANITLAERFHQINNLRADMNKQQINFASKDAAKVAAVVYAVLLAVIGALTVLK